MEHAALYVKNNSLQRAEIKVVLEKYLPLIKWSGEERILDIGCGPGDITANILMPSIPQTYQSVTGCDLSENMVCYANEHNANPKINFIKLDITAESIPEELQGQFDVIFSLCCLHWIPEKFQGQTYKNIYKLLKPNGQILISYVANSHFFNYYKVLSAMPKWKLYMQDADKYIPPYQYCINTQELVQEIVSSTGFDAKLCKLEYKEFTFNSVKSFEDFAEAINPFLQRIPNNLRKDHLTDITNLQQIENNGCEDVKVHINSTLIIVVATKPDLNLLGFSDREIVRKV